MWICTGLIKTAFPRRVKEGVRGAKWGISWDLALGEGQWGAGSIFKVIHVTSISSCYHLLFCMLSVEPVECGLTRAVRPGLSLQTARDYSDRNNKARKNRVDVGVRWMWVSVLASFPCLCSWHTMQTVYVLVFLCKMGRNNSKSFIRFCED